MGRFLTIGRLSEGKTVDLRVKKTKRAIREAFMGLLAGKALSDITVKELCESAEVSKPAFYYHYGNTHDVLLEIEREVIDGIAQSIADADEVDLCSAAFLRSFGRSVFESPLSSALRDGNLRSEFMGMLSSSLGGRFAGGHSARELNKQAFAVTFAFVGLLGMMERLGPKGYDEAIPELCGLMRAVVGTADLP